MSGKADRATRRRDQQRELIHELNQRYYHEHQRAQRLQNDLQMLQSLRATWLFKVARFLNRNLGSLFSRKHPAPFLNEPITITPTEPRGKVSIIIPFRDRLQLLRDCIKSISTSSWRDHEVILMDNDSSDPQMLKYLAHASARERYHVVSSPGEFNFASLCNRGAEQAKGEYLLFLNNDTAVLTMDWLEQMLMVAQQPDVGIVGATLLYPDGTVQHGGMFPCGDGRWDHFFRRQRWDEVERSDAGRSVRSVDAVTGACLLISRELFLELEGFDEKLPLIHNDTDLCHRARQKQLLVTVTPHARLLHYESLSRGFGDT